MVKFGPAGTSENMKSLGAKKSLFVPKILNEMGLDAFEYQCGNGVTISLSSAEALGEEFRKWNVTPSVHAPYYISMSSVDEAKRDKSVDYILQTARVAKAMGADRIVVHTGSCAKISREEALAYASETLKKARKALDDEGLGEVSVCPETMGKINQLGTLEEVLFLCGEDERLIPCIDFGHLNARTLGGIRTKADYAEILDRIRDQLGEYRGRNFHSHFSKIEYTAGGEKRHLTFEDAQFGPEFEPLAELVAERDLSPRFICESSGTMDTDALWMKRCYREKKGV